MSAEEQKQALEIQLASNNIVDNKQTSSADVILSLFDSENWEEVPSFDDLRSKMHQHHESINRIQQSCRRKLHSMVDSIFFQTFMVLLVAFDFVLALTTIIRDENMLSLFTMVIIVIYVCEILLRIYAYGIKNFFFSILNIIDFIAVTGSLILYIYSFYAVYALLVKILRWSRVIRATYKAIFSRTKKIQQAIRNLQRSNLIGYKDDKYDLDITYITDHILIMSRPSRKKLKQFQNNPLSQVKTFLDEKHKDEYKIFDLCVYDNNNNNNSKQNLYSTSASNLSSPELTSDKSSSNVSKSVLSLFPSNSNVDKADELKNSEYEVFGSENINNDYAFLDTNVLCLEKVFEFAEIATKYADENSSNVIIIQSTSGLGRSMFMTACLLFYYYPTASLAEIIRFIQHARISYKAKEKKNDDYLFRKFVPSQLRYYRYFATLITHCYNLAEDVIDEVDEREEEEELGHDRGLSQHIQTIHYHHQQSLFDENIISSINEEIDQLVLHHESKWNFYHVPAMNMLNARIGIVIKQIGIHNYFDEIDPYVNWECDVLQWNKNEYDVHKFGIDAEPGKNSALIRRFDNVKTMVIEKDFALRFYKSKGNDNAKKERKLRAQVILHSHFINLDNANCIKFNKDEIDFVNKDVSHKHFPKDFNIVIKAKILRKKT